MPPKGRKILKAKRTSGAASTATQGSSDSKRTTRSQTKQVGKSASSTTQKSSNSKRTRRDTKQQGKPASAAVQGSSNSKDIQARETSEPTPNKYKFIQAYWNKSVCYKTLLANSSGTFEAEGNQAGPPQDEKEIVELKEKLVNAHVDDMAFYIGDNPENAFNFYSSIFSTIRIGKSLDFEFDGDHDFSEFLLNFLPVVTRGRDFSKVEMKFNWDKTIPQNLPKSRQALQLLPKMENLEIIYQMTKEEGSVYGEVFDDATLLHLASCAKYCKLDQAPNVTAKGLLAAFEAFCGATADGHRELLIHIKKSTADEVFDIVERSEELKGKYEMGSFVMGERYLRIKQTANTKFSFEEARNQTLDTTLIVMLVRRV